jgi:hypothetical protein
MRAGLTRDEVRQAVRQGLDAGRIPWQSVHENPQQRLKRLQVVQDYLQEQYLACYQDYLAQIGPDEEAVAPWQWRQLPAHARARYVQSMPLE